MSPSPPFRGERAGPAACEPSAHGLDARGREGEVGGAAARWVGLPHPALSPRPAGGEEEITVIRENCRGLGIHPTYSEAISSVTCPAERQRLRRCGAGSSVAARRAAMVTSLARLSASGCGGAGQARAYRPGERRSSLPWPRSPP